MAKQKTSGTRKKALTAKYLGVYIRGKDWNFRLPKVYMVNILNFSFEEALMPLGLEVKRADENKFVSRVQLIDRDTGELFVKDPSHPESSNPS